MVETKRDFVDFRQREPPSQIRIAYVRVIVVEVVESSIASVCACVGYLMRGKRKCRLWKVVHDVGWWLGTRRCVLQLDGSGTRRGEFTRPVSVAHVSLKSFLPQCRMARQHVQSGCHRSHFSPSLSFLDLDTLLPDISCRYLVSAGRWRVSDSRKRVEEDMS